MVLLLIIFSCTKKGPADDISRVFHGLSNSNSSGEILKHYSSGTVSAIGKAVNLRIITGNRKLSILPQFNNNTRWRILEKAIDGDRAELWLKYIEHPVENMIGFEMKFKMVREDGMWKIDMEDEIQRSIGKYKNGMKIRY
ncbi:hypothetical protein ACFL20_07995 [Spirochaetota bacterium]